jgi:hypothetical protein
VDEIRIYPGGYHGSADNLPKSYESKMNETYPPPPTESPFLISTILAGIGFIVLLRRKGS